METPHRIASDVLGRLGPAVLPRIRSRGTQPAHVTRVFDPSWIGAIPLPLGDERTAGQTVALADEDEFERTTQAGVLARAYEERPRTRVYESLGVRSDGWFSLAALHLAGLLRRHVVCTAYESSTGDSTLSPHVDQWLGVIVQMRGAKQWQMWSDDGGSPETLVTRAGDVLVLPEHVRHHVSTPTDPGHSAHLVFAVTDRSIETWPDRQSGVPATGPARDANAAQ